MNYNKEALGINGRKPRALVAIASFGEGNRKFLDLVIRNYQGMAMDVDIVVNSNVPKELGSAVQVVVGLPTRNPFSLPFAHKKLFAEKVNCYDLFIYTEDDIEVAERNIQAFLKMTRVLEPNELVGHVRYEIGHTGTRYLPDVHGPYRWKLESVRSRGQHTFAEFTNEHAGFYILTQAQLRRVIASGGYLQEPYDGRYGMLETAATDPFTRCGFRRVICISEPDDFLVHHMSNRYAGEKGITMAEFKKQLGALADIALGNLPATTLCEVEPKVLQSRWCKKYDETAREEVLQCVPQDASTVLSVGCGCGKMEMKLVERGARVTALPLDSVVGAMVANQGIEVLHGTLREGPRILNGRKFKCVLISNILHLLSDPWSMLEEFAELVEDGGSMIIAGPNFDLLTTWGRRILGRSGYRRLSDFGQSGLHVHRPGEVFSRLERLGFVQEETQWYDHAGPARLAVIQAVCSWLTARRWVIRARASRGVAGLSNPSKPFPK